MSVRVFLSGAHLVLPDRIETGRTLVIEDGRIADIVAGPREVGDGETRVHLPDCFILPGFVDVHVHGIAGLDVLDGPSGVADVAARLPRHGVTAFCPTSIASSARSRRVCSPMSITSSRVSPILSASISRACLR